MKEQKNVEISIIVPVYNVEKYLKKCIDSIMNQTFKNFELILVDDGSTDGSSNICDEYEKVDKRITVVHKRNGGLSSARNAGIDIANGKYITFIDSDDFVDNRYCEYLYSTIIEYDADIVISDFIRYKSKEEILSSDNRIIISVKDGKSACKELYSNSVVKYVVAWGKLFKSELVRKHYFLEGKIHEDEFFTYKLYYESNVVVELFNKLYYYRINPNSITMNVFTLKKYDTIDALNERIDYFKKKNELELVKLTEELKIKTIAEYSILARKTGIYEKIPNKYKISIFKALQTMRRLLNNDQFEWMLYQYYPRITKIYLYILKLKKR